MHQDAHEFFNWILNAIIEQQKKMEAMEQADTSKHGLKVSLLREIKGYA